MSTENNWFFDGLSHRYVDRDGYYQEADKEALPVKSGLLRELRTATLQAPQNFVRGHFTGSPEGRHAYRGGAEQVHVSDTLEYEYREATVSRRHTTRYLGEEAVSAAELIARHSPTIEGQTPHDEAAPSESAA